MRVYVQESERQRLLHHHLRSHRAPIEIDCGKGLLFLAPNDWELRARRLLPKLLTFHLRIPVVGVLVAVVLAAEERSKVRLENSIRAISFPLREHCLSKIA
jgi:hypothetical protein